MGTIGFGIVSLTSRMRVPRPPQRMATLGDEEWGMGDGEETLDISNRVKNLN
jgi:hypothetical protein